MYDHSDYHILTFEVTSRLCKTPMQLRVRRFQLREGDITIRRCSENEDVKEQKLQPYCLADIDEAAAEFESYIYENTVDGLYEAAKGSDELVKATFYMIAMECRATNTRYPAYDDKAAHVGNDLKDF